MSLFLTGLVIIFAGGLASLFSGRKPAAASFSGSICAAAGSIVAVIPAFRILINGVTESFRAEWSVPYGSFFIRIDTISALFLIPVLILSAVAAIYGFEYMLPYRDKKNLGVHWFFYNLLLAGMVLVITAANSVLFLVAWELMSVASFFLVTFEHEKESVRQAGLIYLVAMHIGTAFLIMFFVIAGVHAGSMDFDSIPAVPSALAGIMFILAVIGFGTKAGFMPLHVWLPYAHPAAPSHVSAVMSGVMIKTGIYGVVRAVILLGPPPAWWGWLLICTGAVSGVLGVLFALAQHDIKRLLAYHSVENIGIITTGLGAGVLGISMNSPALAVLGFAGGFFHVINHAVFKGLLFLSAGSVIHACGTGHIDLLGGIIKRMPWTALTFLTGSIAISGLPPLNGFASEFLIYLGGFKNILSGGIETVVSALLVIGSLALIGGLALACFTKAFGIIFLGHARSDYAVNAHESGNAMKFSMAMLAVFCLLLGVCSPLVIEGANNVIIEMIPLEPGYVKEELASASGIMQSVVLVSLILIAVTGFFILLRKQLLRGRSVRESVTWDCGYVKPEARMQYTAASFAQPLTDIFKIFLRTGKKCNPPKGLFPSESDFRSETTDITERYMFAPAVRLISMLSGLRWLQHGRLQIYILYIALTLWILLIWKLL